ncbi:MAG: tannase/feruloyl esterase family alpha/beta hydrolase [Myxococcales bacterium]|nr:tannase/feruloyl esterase family alpha/beta hydrolase [Myxococcales bacterium]
MNPRNLTTQAAKRLAFVALPTCWLCFVECGNSGGQAGGMNATFLDGGGASNGDAGGAAGPRLACDDTLKTAFKPDANTSVILVKSFRQGDPIALASADAGMPPPTAGADLCLVKLIVGPGFQDTSPTAPSSSPGIGIEVWLPTPAAWNGRIQNLGGGGWAGGSQSSPTRIGNAAAAVPAASGYVVGTTDTGHSIGNGSFAMTQDGGINTTLWTDFAERSLHELAMKTKALALGFYGTAPQFAYWNGCSTGGRQGYKIAQTHPDDYDGYLVGAPAFNWAKFITTELHPEIVMQRDLGAPLSTDKLTAMSAAAVSACDMVGGQHLGFILDPTQCRYDPTKDASVLCQGVAGNGGVVGTSTSASCVSLVEAQAMNKIWYGQTRDGTVPDPATDNAGMATLASGQLWWGLVRGTNLMFLAGMTPFTIATDQVALELQTPTLATPTFMNATGNGANGWTQLTYANLAMAFDQGVALQPSFGNINTDVPDLSMARDRGAKIISYHGLADILITPMGSINYYSRVSASVGGDAATNQFNRLFLIPGMGHCAGVGTVSGTSGPMASNNTVPLPGATQFFDTLVAWVEHKTAPDSLVLRSADGSVSLPVCPYPKKITYGGSGSITDASSYSCM